MSARTVILFDFVNGEVRRITQDEAAQIHADGYARGIRMTCGGVPAWIYQWGEFGRWLRARRHAG